MILLFEIRNPTRKSAMRAAAHLFVCLVSEKLAHPLPTTARLLS